ncbi:MAG: hypothetical protein ACKV2T_18160 [Kofleriaceae bacterium]
MKAYLLIGSMLGSALGCATAPEEDTELAGPATAEALDDIKADGGELKIRAGNMTVWVDRDVVVRRENNAPVLVVRGRASRTLTGAFSFVPDDAFGEARLVGPRSFEVRLRAGHEINSIASGLPLLVDLDAGSDPDTNYTVKLDLRPSLAKFQGASSIFIARTMRPIFIGRDETDPLRYAADISTTAAPLTVANGGNASVVPANGGFDVLFSYSDLEAAWNTGTKVAFSAAGKTKSATVEARITKLAMTTEDPYEAFPPARCNQEAYNCSLEFQGVDLQTCGDYRVVSDCVFGDICEITENAAPLSIRPLGLDFVWQNAAEAYREGCTNGGTWCSLGEIDAFFLPECLVEEPTFEQVVAQVAAATDDQDFAAGPFAGGEVLGRTTVQGTPTFSNSYSVGAPLFQAIDAHMGSGEIRAWRVVEEIPCHNCTEYRYKLFMWWPGAFRIVAITGRFGHD